MCYKSQRHEHYSMPLHSQSTPHSLPLTAHSYIPCTSILKLLHTFVLSASGRTATRVMSNVQTANVRKSLKQSKSMRRLRRAVVVRRSVISSSLNDVRKGELRMSSGQCRATVCCVAVTYERLDDSELRADLSS